MEQSAIFTENALIKYVVTLALTVVIQTTFASIEQRCSPLHPFLAYLDRKSYGTKQARRRCTRIAANSIALNPMADFPRNNMMTDSSLTTKLYKIGIT